MPLSEHHTTVRDIAVDGAKASPALGGLTAVLSGVTLETWVLLATLVYSLLLILEKLWKWRVPQRLWGLFLRVWSWSGARFEQ